MKNAELFRRAQQVTPGGVHSPVRAWRSVGGEPLFIRAGAGAELEAENGQRYTDYCLAFGPLILGHAPPTVKLAVADALERGWSFGAAEVASLELAELVTGRIPWAEQLRFVNSGTEAVMTALRLARAAAGRDRILKFEGCYHGHSDAVLIRAGSGLAGAGASDSAGIPAGVAADTLVAALDDESSIDRVFAAHADIAAAIIEPLPANYGLLPQRRAFLEHLAKRCRANGTLLIFDEVITGFRVAFGGCAELLGIEPDLVTWGKIIGGGFPVGAVAGRRELLGQLAPDGAVYQAGTLSANPVAMAAGRATLDALLDGRVHARLEALGEQLANAASALRGLRLQRAGSMFWLAAGDGEIIRTPAAIPGGQADFYRRLFQAALQAGIYLPPSPVETAFLSAAHQPSHVDALAQAIASAC